MSSRGVGGEAGFTGVHPGLPRGGIDLPLSRVEVAFMPAPGDCWMGLFLGCAILFLLLAQRREEAVAGDALPQLAPHCNGRLRLGKKQSPRPALGSPYWSS